MKYNMKDDIEEILLSEKDLQKAVNDTLGNGFFTAFHNVVHKFCKNLTTINWIV